MGHLMNAILGRKLAELEKRAEMEKTARFTVSRFHGIRIEMDKAPSKREPPPHVHVVHGGDEAKVNIYTGKVFEGSLRSAQAWKVEEWINRYRNELLIMWNGNPNKLPALFF